MDLLKIGNIIKERRKMLKLRQEDLSEMSEVNMKTIQQTELGKGNPSYLTLINIFTILGLEIRVEVKQRE